ncbi:MAG: hypothetical protein A2286_05675 [Gammaproteobacteria bacterium RIFOXYA12_FULL_61_12]|nr:MAG: hypothetical protein A2514_04085 [Gammaproteobacteria bacterium RIFOXYD12_FULL_61_37]OGT91188.1 MAG: hypothetical protein A2286_05675 [Gammaproteobacteria bacterium RIFOXYA12_FULL_61_12]
MTQEDRELFQQATADTTPIDANLAEPFRTRRRPIPLDQPPEHEPEEANYGDTLLNTLCRGYLVKCHRNSQTHDELSFQRPGIQNRLFLDLRRGKLPPEETLDLHGYHVEEARRLLKGFIRRAQLRRYRCVRIIHGKGKGSAGQQPVLKQKVNQWLPQSEEVLAYCSAPRWDGGTGATYVLLARVKTE